MDYEKKYKEALEHIKDNEPDENGIIHIRPFEIFPELKESEESKDEKIRKTLIAYMASVIEINGIKGETIIAWLEKQGEKNPVKCMYSNDNYTDEERKVLCDGCDEDCKLNDRVIPKFKVGDIIRLKGTVAEYTIKKVTDTTYYTNGWSCSIERCEEYYELVEQKPVEFKSCNRAEELSLSLQIQAYLNTASDELYTKGKPLYSEKRIEDIHKCMKMWAKLHNVYFYGDSKQEPAEWSEEDEIELTNIIIMLKEGASLHFNKNDITKAVNFLKPLRPQKNNWERVTKEIYFKEPVLIQRKDKSDSWEGYRVCSDHTLNPQTDECYIRVKDINNQKQWRPTEKQIMALRWVLNHIPYDIHKEEISGLLEQIKEL